MLEEELVLIGGGNKVEKAVSLKSLRLCWPWWGWGWGEGVGGGVGGSLVFSSKNTGQHGEMTRSALHLKRVFLGLLCGECIVGA